MKRPKTLSAAFVKTVKRPGRYGDGLGGHGLSLLVKPTSVPGRLSKTWGQRLRIHGKDVNVGLGSYPVVTLSHARTEALSNRRTVARAGDPRGDGVPSFADAVEKVLAIHRPNWKNGASEAQWRASLRDYAIPLVGSKRVDKITTGDVLAVLLPIWNEKRETARRVRQRIGAVMQWAVAKGYREDNPAGDAIGAALPKNGGKRKHFQALPHGKVAAALAAVEASGAWLGTKLAFRFLVLTAARSGEVRNARWDEIDLEAAKTWTVPADRSKSGREHRVPLSAAALAVLERAREIADPSGLIFPSVSGRAMSAMTMTKLLHDLGVEAVPHGFRSSFRDWCGECSNAPREVAEAALAHVVRDKVEAAYARSDLFERRRVLMEDWMAYLAG